MPCINQSGSSADSGISSSNSVAALTESTGSSALVAGDLVLNGVAISGSVGSADGSSLLNGSSSSIAKVAAINDVSDQSGVKAVVNENVVAGTATAAGTTENIILAVNGVQISLANSSSTDIEVSMAGAVDSINAKSGVTGVVASFSGNATEGITLTAADGRNITLGGTAADSAAALGIANTGSTLATGTGNDTYVGTYTLISEDGSDIAVTTNTGDIDNAGFEVGTYSGTGAGVVGDNVAVAADLADGDLIINGTSVGPSQNADDTASTENLSESAIAKAAAINRVSDQTDVVATVNANRVNSGDLAAGASSYQVTINDIDVDISLSTSGSASDHLTAAIDAVNSNSGLTGVRAEALDADSFTLVADDGRNITIEVGVANASAEIGIASTVFTSSVSLDSGGSIELGTNTGNIANAGFRVGTYGNGETGSGLDTIDITTAAGAEAAVIAAA